MPASDAREAFVRMLGPHGMPVILRADPRTHSASERVCAVIPGPARVLPSSELERFDPEQCYSKPSMLAPVVRGRVEAGDATLSTLARPR